MWNWSQWPSNYWFRGPCAAIIRARKLGRAPAPQVAPAGTPKPELNTGTHFDRHVRMFSGMTTATLYEIESVDAFFDKDIAEDSK